AGSYSWEKPVGPSNPEDDGHVSRSLQDGVGRLVALPHGVRQKIRVHLIARVVCSTAAERGCSISCSVGLFFTFMVSL
ncbi:MAG: hypothetical protein ACK56F_06560, partial [bacterium]